MGCRFNGKGKEFILRRGRKEDGGKKKHQCKTSEEPLYGIKEKKKESQKVGGKES